MKDTKTTRTVWLLKSEIKKGQIAELESLKRGATALYLVLTALADENTKIIKTKYKELSELTSYAKDTISKLLNALIEGKFLEKLSKQGSRQSVFKLL